MTSDDTTPPAPPASPSAQAPTGPTSVTKPATYKADKKISTPKANGGKGGRKSAKNKPVTPPVARKSAKPDNSKAARTARAAGRAAKQLSATATLPHDDSPAGRLALLPPVRRARGNRLYLETDRRLLDLWLDDGRIILGERERNSRLYARDAAEKGLTRAYPGLYNQRLRSALQRTWPQFTAVRFYQNEERALQAWYSLSPNPSQASPTNQPLTPVEAFAWPADAAIAANNLLLLRPFTEVPAGCRFALVRLPCARPFAPACLLAAQPADLAVLHDDLLPAMLPYAATRALDSLASCEHEGYTEAHWASSDARLGRWFERRGPYLFARLSVGNKTVSYDDFFRAALAGDALVSPDPLHPAIVPPIFDPGELKKLDRALEGLFGA